MDALKELIENVKGINLMGATSLSKHELEKECHSGVRVAIVAPHASSKFGGESILPLHYFRFLRRRGIEAWMVLHARTRDELKEVLGADIERVMFIEDSRLHIVLHWLSRHFFGRVGHIIFGLLLRFATQISQKKLLKVLVKRQNINVVHEPSPVSPRYPSLIYKVGAPVVIGPMNGGMSYPEPFKYMEGAMERWFIRVGRSVSVLANILLSGKRQASRLLVANVRTAESLPLKDKSKVVELVENGVDLGVFHYDDAKKDVDVKGGKVRFVFMGRLVGWKAVDILLEVFSVLNVDSAELHILGGGEELDNLKGLATELGLNDRVYFHGFRPQKECANFLSESDVLILPSLYECGGAVVLEAMAMGKAVIASNWGGPSDYLDEESGILVDPTQSVDIFKASLKEAIQTLASNSELRVSMGRNGREKVLRDFAWEKKVERILEIYEDVIGSKS